ncbi:dienelactone hydrolase family protein [Sphingobium sufflavum]|uniref:dienelactone hydrolase family protein n=1 Tax=Sphingobium sufflavum TaxID=1129547 RepID=UPI001F1AA76C|nr:dienelactone hydrolase family protein [Sphingobium sufflavum]MCE7797743.1 dienelactone hydrolase family protein [Sphingobium sufflavum]
MAIERHVRVYEASGGTYESVAVYDPTAGEQPGLLIFPNFLGTKEWDFAKGEKLAALGFKVLVVDFYGQGKRGTDMASGAALMTDLASDRAAMREKLRAHHAELFRLPDVKPGRVAAIGFCFGGKCVLDLARSGANIAGVVNHGVYDAPSIPNEKIVAKLLVNHGWNDDYCPPEATVALAQELTAADVDWQLIAYSRTGHAFTANDVPQNAEQSFGFQPDTDRRSWQATVNFYEETFG